MKHLWFLVISLLFLSGLFPAVAVAQNVVITVPSAVEVEGEDLFLGQLAKIKAEPDRKEKLNRINLGRAPRFGETVWLYRTNVIYALDRSELAGAYTLEMPAKVSVTRAGQLVTRELMLAAIEKHVQNQASPFWTAWRVEPGHLQERRIPKGKLEYQFEGDKTPLKPGLNTFRLGMVVNGEVFTTIPVTVRLTIEAPVYVITQKINRYAELTADSLRREVRELATGNEWLAELTAGKYRATRDLVAGKVLMVRDLQEKPVITKGSKVRLIFESGPVQVELAAQAEEDGWLHEQITVTNLSSNRRLTATVLGPGVVEVTLE